MIPNNNHYCGSCNYANPDGSSHCGGCGKKLEQRCPICGSPYKNTVFCGNCGQALSEEVKSGQAIIGSSDTAPPQNMVQNTQLPAPGQLGKLIYFTLRTYRLNFGSFASLSLISGIPLFILSIYISLIIDSSIQSPEIGELEKFGEPFLLQDVMDQLNWQNILILASLIILVWITSILSTAAIIFGAAQFIQDGKVSQVLCIDYALSCSIKLIGVSIALPILLIIPLLLSFILIGIPLLVFLLIRWNFAVCAVVLEDKGVINSLKRSWLLVTGNWWITFGTVLAVLVLIVIPSAVLGLINTVISSFFENFLVSHILEGITTVVIIPFASIATGIYFLGLRMSKESEVSGTDFESS